MTEYFTYLRNTRRTIFVRRVSQTLIHFLEIVSVNTFAARPCRPTSAPHLLPHLNLTQASCIRSGTRSNVLNSDAQLHETRAWTLPWRVRNVAGACSRATYTPLCHVPGSK